MKKALLILTALCAAGCEQASVIAYSSYHSVREQQIINRLEPICLRGVVYYFYGGVNSVAMSPAYNQDGTLILCINDAELEDAK